MSVQSEHGPEESRALPRIVPAQGIAQHDVDQDALRVLSRLQRSGYEAYLVGGCVRDLLLGRKPKDFDVATAAHPRQVKRLFKNGRIIGRRFRLVHVVYGQHVVETATFRSDPGSPEDEEADLLITEDNVYGTAAEDARRRDFTVNALLFDPNRGEIHDYVDGLTDLEAGVLRTIGEPAVRFAEDPVRILRAIKFATRLGFRIEENTWQAMCALASELTRSAPPRVVEEILRLLRSGTALGAFRMMRASGALAALLPEINGFLGTRNDPDPAAHDLLIRALDAQAITTIQVPEILRQWRKPRFPQFEGRTAWSLFNAFTAVVGAGSVWTVAKRSQLLHGVFDAHCSLATGATGALLPAEGALPAPLAA